VSKVLAIAWREFISTVATKGFIIGVLFTPLLILVAILGIGYLMNEKPPKIDGELAVIDPTGRLTEDVARRVSPEAISARWEEEREEIAEVTPEPLRRMAEAGGAGATEAALEQAFGQVPHVRVVELPETADLEAEKNALHAATEESGGRLAVAVIHGNAIDPGPDGEWGNYDLYVRPKLDDRIEDEIKGALGDSILDARIRARGLDPEEMKSLTHVGRVRSVTVTEEGEQETNEILNTMLPAGFMILLLMSVFMGGQQLMTTTVEEKSSRVVEMLLSACSPMQLMAGKILGQLCVGFVIMALYAGLGLSALFSFAVAGLIDPMLFLYLILFYLIAYFIIGSMMAAIGAAVNELREAQSLMTPVIVIVMIPWILWMPITRNPDSTVSVVLSFIPPINTFVLMLRMTSTTPPPAWQVWLSIAIGIASVYGALWVAAKVFRIGLLMYGKPPNLATLVRWVRMA
jgi:ABC-2 type transport system permease protein